MSIRSNFIADRARADSASVPIVDVARQGDRVAWDAYVETQVGATLYHLFGWKEVAEEAYGSRAPFLLARDATSGTVCGVLPLIRVPRPFTQYLTNGLFGAYGPLLADNDRCAHALVTTAARRIDAGEAKHLHLKILGDAPVGLALERQDIWVDTRLDLAGREDTLWQSLPRKLRWSIRRAKTFGLEARCGPDEFEGFYEVLFDNMHRKGAPIYGRKFFRTVFRVLGPKTDVITLRHEGRVVSGAFVASFNGTMYTPFSSSRAEYFKAHASHLLFWEIMRRALQRGCHTLDFGSSLRDSTVLDFKMAWRPRVEPIASYVHAAPGVRPKLDPRGSAVAATIIAAWARLPPGMAHALGPALCRWIA